MYRMDQIRFAWSCIPDRTSISKYSISNTDRKYSIELIFSRWLWYFLACIPTICVYLSHILRYLATYFNKMYSINKAQTNVIKVTKHNSKVSLYLTSVLLLVSGSNCINMYYVLIVCILPVCISSNTRIQPLIFPEFGKFYLLGALYIVSIWFNHLTFHTNLHCKLICSFNVLFVIKNIQLLSLIDLCYL